MYGSDRLVSNLEKMIRAKEKEKLLKLYDSLSDYASGEEIEDDVTLYLLEF